MARDRLKSELVTFLSDLPEDPIGEDVLSSLASYADKYPPIKIINTLFPLFYHSIEIVRWRAISMFGIAVDRLANLDMEQARVIMRRLMWNLNDESGGIGWGSPEAIGESITINNTLYSEFSNILLSYIHPKRNYLEYEPLQAGALWAAGRVAYRHLDFLQNETEVLIPHLNSNNPKLRGISSWIASLYKHQLPNNIINSLKIDTNKIDIYISGELKTFKICRWF